jgi:hypothetical protein
MNKFLPLLMLVSVALAACANDPTLQDVSAGQVIVMGNGAGEPALWAEAARGCAIYNRTPLLKSQTCTDNLCQRKRYHFACRAT